MAVMSYHTHAPNQACRGMLGAPFQGLSVNTKTFTWSYPDRLVGIKHGNNRWTNTEQWMHEFSTDILWRARCDILNTAVTHLFVIVNGSSVQNQSWKQYGELGHTHRGSHMIWVSFNGTITRRGIQPSKPKPLEIHNMECCSWSIFSIRRSQQLR